MTNGLRVHELEVTVDALRREPRRRAVLHARNHWIDGGHTRSWLDSGGSHPTDLPDELGGCGQGPEPVELLLHALASSVTTSLVLAADAHDVVLLQIETTVEAALDQRGLLGWREADGTAPPPFDAIGVTVRAGGECSASVLAGLLDDAWRRSPIVAALSGANELHHAIEVVPS